MDTTRLERRLRAPRSAVYRALLDPGAVARWRVPHGMASRVHRWEAREGGTVRVSLTYETTGQTGKTTASTDTYTGRFVRLVPDETVVEVDEFETDDPDLRGEMTMTVTLADTEDGTLLVAVHEGLPRGVSAADNEAGWTSALDRLAALVEGRG
ncbi:SRPBCC family protein [Geodermatophilus sp. CPCC 206100]|uniref:SRPBCC family protein n=1 Tax=Geodermatophilus sp. CPCC 206100 TaxID=3020054 RepID=UPI003B00684D